MSVSFRVFRVSALTFSLLFAFFNLFLIFFQRFFYTPSGLCFTFIILTILIIPISKFSYEESISELNRVLESGGNFYDYVDNMDAPEKIKKKYLLSYEKERAKEILGIPQMMPGFNPKTSDMEEVYEWHLKQEEAIKKYILSHPDDFRIKNEADFDE